MNKKLIFISLTILQLIFLTGMIFFYRSTITSATKILLETEPVDPFSVFRGRYINLNYKISTLPVNLFKDCKPRELKSNDHVYVILKEKDKFWQSVSAYKNCPKDPTAIYLKGKVRYASGDNVQLEYGIESFFLSEKSADEIESNRARFRGNNWQEIEKLRKEKMESLSEEDKRIHKAGVTEHWFKSLNKELDYWLKEGIIQQETATRIREKYTKALERIKAAQQIERERTVEQPVPLTVEVAVTKNGTGHPTKLFWEGREYR